uniref:Uncharacterized protein n=1 Tax=Rhizophora mucronata TaxID=61149 RepID=A0A2P2J4D2_RHIMU
MLQDNGIEYHYSQPANLSRRII